MKKRTVAGIAIALCGMASAAFISYTITGASGDNWSGQFEVVSLDVAVNFMSYDDPPVENTLGLSANGWEPVGFNYHGSGGGGWLGWQEYDFDTYEAYGLTLVSQELYADVYNNATWNDLAGKTYVISSMIDDTEYKTEFYHPTEGLLQGTGGQISFAAVPEPATALSLMLGGLVIAGYRRVRKAYGC